MRYGNSRWGTFWNIRGNSVLRSCFWIPLVVMCCYPFSADTLRSNLPPFVSFATPKMEEFDNYRHYYGLDSLEGAHCAGTFKSGDFTCVGYVFRPSISCGTVFFLHGLFDHIGLLGNGIRTCLQQGYTVAAFDLPGHGLSSGEPAAVNSFTDYTNALNRFISLCLPHCDTPLVYIGHSTGCAVGLDYVQREQQPFAAIIFLAPLARSAAYHLSRIGNSLLKRFTRTTARLNRSVSHDKSFGVRRKKDPLQTWRLPLSWVEAYFAWWKRARQFPVCNLPLTVIQGTADGVVDWKYNMRFYRQKIPVVTIVTLPRARHHILNESPEYLQPVCNHITAVLQRVQGTVTCP